MKKEEGTVIEEFQAQRAVSTAQTARTQPK
jgi:hypothetical protein